MCHYLSFVRFRVARPIFCHSASVNLQCFRTLSLIAATSPWDTTKPICLSPLFDDDVQHRAVRRSSKPYSPSSFLLLLVTLTLPSLLSPNELHDWKQTNRGMHRRRCLPVLGGDFVFSRGGTRERLGCAICMARNYKALSIIFQT